LFPFPLKILQAGAYFFGKSSEFHRLCDNLQVDNFKTKQLLGWSPPFLVSEGLKQTVLGSKYEKNF
jgi:UDP-glucose 4-epimerase